MQGLEQAVAEGKADVYPRFGPTMERYTDAGRAIAEESGAFEIELLKKKPILYNNKKSMLNPLFRVSRHGVDSESI